MKKLLLTLAAIGFIAPVALFADNYLVFRVCEDQHILRTSDGAEAGRVEYIIVEPVGHRIVSTVITGGVVGERLVAMPFSIMRFGGEREVILTEITRERLVSAPVIERTRFTARAEIEPAFVHPTFTHFGVDISAGSREGARPEHRPKPETTTGNTPPVQKPGQPEAKPEKTTEKPVQKPGQPEAKPEKTTEKPVRKPGQPEAKPEKTTEKPIRKPGQPEAKPEKTTEKPVRKPDQPEAKPEKTTEKPVRKLDQPEGKPEKTKEKSGEKP